MSVSGSVGIVYVLASWVCWWLVFWWWALVVCVRLRLVFGLVVARALLRVCFAGVCGAQVFYVCWALLRGFCICVLRPFRFCGLFTVSAYGWCVACSSILGACLRVFGRIVWCLVASVWDVGSVGF